MEGVEGRTRPPAPARPLGLPWRTPSGGIAGGRSTPPTAPWLASFSATRSAPPQVLGRGRSLPPEWPRSPEPEAFPEAGAETAAAGPEERVETGATRFLERPESRPAPATPRFEETPTTTTTITTARRAAPSVGRSATHPGETRSETTPDGAIDLPAGASHPLITPPQRPEARMGEPVGGTEPEEATPARAPHGATHPTGGLAGEGAPPRAVPGRAPDLKPAATRAGARHLDPAQGTPEPTPGAPAAASRSRPPVAAAAGGEAAATGPVIARTGRRPATPAGEVMGGAPAALPRAGLRPFSAFTEGDPGAIAAAAEPAAPGFEAVAVGGLPRRPRRRKGRRPLRIANLQVTVQAPRPAPPSRTRVIESPLAAAPAPGGRPGEGRPAPGLPTRAQPATAPGPGFDYPDPWDGPDFFD